MNYTDTTKYVNNGNLEKNMIIKLKNRPVVIIDFAFSKCGKHGVQKVWIKGKDLFNCVIIEDILKRCEFSELVIPEIKTYTIVGIYENNIIAVHDEEGVKQIQLSSKNLIDEITLERNQHKLIDVEIMCYENDSKIIAIKEFDYEK